MKKMIVIDGNSLLFRAFYATSFPGAPIMQTKDGQPTNAIFAFSNMILKIINDQKEEFNLCVAFDTGKKTFRHSELETYKANRKPVPTELVSQMPLARELLKNMGVFIYEQEGVEGDDIAGTVAKKAKEEGYDVTIYTSDRDFLQLIEDNITIYILKKGLSDIAIMNHDAMVEKYGFEPIQIQDYKGLMGDPSDNLPGIPGVGEKTAIKLIQEYQSLENIIEAAKTMTSKLGQKIIENQELGKLCKHLAIIKTDVELPFTINDTLYKGFHFDELREFCIKYELKQLLAKIKPAKSNTNEIKNEEIRYTIIENTNDIDFDSKISVAIDINDKESSYFRASIYGLSFTNKNENYYISIDNLKKDQKLLDVLKDESHKIIAYNFKQIRGALSTQNIEINGLEDDIFIAAYLLDSSFVNNIEQVGSLFGFTISPGENSFDLFQEGNPKRTCEISYQINKILPKLHNTLQNEELEKLYYQIEIPLVTVLSDMEIEGFPLDVNTLDSLGVTFKDNLNQLKNEIFHVVGHEFNIDSPKQVATVLFDELGLKENKKRSTSVEILNDLYDDHIVIPLLLSYRKYAKIVTTYIDGLKSYIFDDGKLHCLFNQAVTTTGRLSSSEPNLQNISIRDEEAKSIRKAFYYKENNISIMSYDYSQIELRLLANFSHCQKLIDTFNSGKDIHAETARHVFHINEDEVPSPLRRKAKAVNFGIVYGISNWGLSKQINVSAKEADQIIQNFYDAYPEVASFLQQTIYDVQDNGFVKTMFGRKRYIREIFDSNYSVREFAKRAAMNAPIQGTAADLIKIAMIDVAKEIKNNNLKSKLVLQIHDELIFKVYDDEVDKLTNIVKNCMENAIKLDVKLEVDGGVAKTWYDAK